MQERALKVARITSIVAGVFIALASGTNYAYSTWAPQFGQRLRLSSTETNLIGSFGNLGMYIPAILVGIVVDSKGPRIGVASGAVLLGLGYLGIYIAFKIGPGSFNVATLCFFYFLTGFGSCAAFLAALKTAAVNYPDSRGTATGLPLAGYGLSAFTVSVIFNFAFPDDTAKLLLMLTILPFVLNITSLFFVYLLPPSTTTKSAPATQRQPDSQVLHLARSHDGQSLQLPTYDEPEDLSTRRSVERSSRDEPEGNGGESYMDTGETSSLLSKSSESTAEEYGLGKSAKNQQAEEDDIRGLALLLTPKFWQLFFMFGLLSGIGLMNINNIGNDVQALWHHYDDSASEPFIAKQQSIHVSILSLGSCAGRLMSGVGSDLLAKKLNMNRMWCLFGSATAFTAAQFSSSQIENPHYLAVVSAFTGLAYGTLYGFFPSLLVHKFGVKGLSQNWGTIILAPVISGNIFNLFYGKIFDKHSVVLPDGERECLEGLLCYQTTSLVTFFVGLVAMVMSLASIWNENRIWRQRQAAPARTDHDRDA